MCCLLNTVNNDNENDNDNDNGNGNDDKDSDDHNDDNNKLRGGHSLNLKAFQKNLKLYLAPPIVWL